MLAPIMAAIALAESGGRTNALNNNPSTGDYSVGLWQINYFGNLLPGRTSEYGSPAFLSANPSAQAKAAISLAGNGSGLSNWTTYTSGAYLAHLPSGSATAPIPGGTLNLDAGQTSAGVTGGPSATLTSSGGPLNIGGVLKGGLTDLAKLAVGAALVWAGIKMLTSGQSPVQVVQGVDRSRRRALRADEDRHYDQARTEAARTKASPAGRRAAARARAAQRRTVPASEETGDEF